MFIGSLPFSIFGLFGILAVGLLPACQILGVIKLAHLGRGIAWWIMLAGAALPLLVIPLGAFFGLQGRPLFSSGQNLLSILALSGPVLFAAGFAFSGVRAVALQKRTAMLEQTIMAGTSTPPIGSARRLS